MQWENNYEIHDTEDATTFVEAQKPINLIATLDRKSYGKANSQHRIWCHVTPAVWGASTGTQP